MPKIKHTDSDNFFLLCGPCAIEGEDMALRIAEKVVSITDKLEIPYVFKGSFKKANRSRIDSFTGIGNEKALKILKKVSETFDIPTVTDIHEVSDAAMAAEYVDVLQIPAFLVRQTDLVVAAAKTGKVVNLKKGQFMSPEAMKHAVQKVKDSGNDNAWITDRGTMFGYQDMIVDFRGIPTMRQYAPTVLDVTHSLQQPNQTIGVTGGRPDMIETVARAGVVNNVDGLFIETHFDPANAKSDGANMLHLDNLEGLLNNLVAIRKLVSTF
ncbi:MAG: 3-deoxy-8-phosphooctulonate synthase [Winogradskyella sp.]|uniref:3-deoxy-8-phosphooctulonate synthase n=1 Tax=Winogradskyella sp. TaxID=1883156 RepID=UPI0025FFDA50|nr:3-deoxy-8-phosphooctulonate synthase [Winogradskyella sp.]NRB61263.1 3-deoxy-8-phosphooctulonate synthase [Winogradskyella sp.]